MLIVRPTYRSSYNLEAFALELPGYKEPDPGDQGRSIADRFFMLRFLEEGVRIILVIYGNAT